MLCEDFYSYLFPFYRFQLFGHKDLTIQEPIIRLLMAKKLQS